MLVMRFYMQIQSTCQQLHAGTSRHCSYQKICGGMDAIGSQVQRSLANRVAVLNVSLVCWDGVNILESEVVIV